MELSESGEMVKWAIYHPFGREIVSVSASPVLPPLGSSIASGSHGSRYSFAGKEKDRESDVHYFEWRYYDDGSGRFTSVDPVYYEVWITERGKEALLDPEMMHPYVYARNGPMRYVDPSGESADAVVDGGYTSWYSAKSLTNLSEMTGSFAAQKVGQWTGWKALEESGRREVQRNQEALKGNATEAAIWATALAIPGVSAPALKWLQAGVKGLSKAEDFFKGTKYSDKVLWDLKRWDNHSFSELVKNFAKDGKVQDIKWWDGNMYQKLNIEWSYKWQKGTFEFIKDKNWVINHHFFNPSR
jgi:RHS repeat-associated protein